MAALVDHFDILETKVGSGWNALFIRVRNWVSPNQFSSDRMVCLSNEIIRPEELDAHIDELIEQLEALRVKGRRKLQRMARRNQRNA